MREKITPQPVIHKSWGSTSIFEIPWGFPYPPPWHQAAMLAWIGWVVLKVTGGGKFSQPKPLRARAVQRTRCLCWVATAASLCHLSSGHRMLSAQPLCTKFGSRSPRDDSRWSHLFFQFSRCCAKDVTIAWKRYKFSNSAKKCSKHSPTFRGEEIS